MTRERAHTDTGVTDAALIHILNLPISSLSAWIHSKYSPYAEQGMEKKHYSNRRTVRSQRWENEADYLSKTETGGITWPYTVSYGEIHSYKKTSFLTFYITWPKTDAHNET